MRKPRQILLCVFVFIKSTSNYKIKVKQMIFYARFPDYSSSLTSKLLYNSHFVFLLNFNPSWNESIYFYFGLTYFALETQSVSQAMWKPTETFYIHTICYFFLGLFVKKNDRTKNIILKKKITDTIEIRRDFYLDV